MLEGLTISRCTGRSAAPAVRGASALTVDSVDHGTLLVPLLSLNQPCRTARTFVAVSESG
jgi:hypothetical protein